MREQQLRAEQRDVSEALSEVAAATMDRAVQLLDADEGGPEEAQLERALERLGGLLAPEAVLGEARFDDFEFEEVVGEWMDEYEDSLGPDASPEDAEQDPELAERMLQQVLPQLATSAAKQRLSHLFAKAALEPDLDEADRVAISIGFLTIDAEIPAEASLGLREVYFAQLDDWAEQEDDDETDVDD